MSWEVAISRAVANIVPRVYEILERHPYLLDLAKELRRAKEEVISNFDYYIDMVREAVGRIGGRFYLASDAGEAREIVGKLVGRGKLVVMSKNNVAAETRLRQYLEEIGNEVWETDLGELLIQLANEEPSHILAPALHMTRERAAKVIKERLGVDVPPDPRAIAEASRRFLREKFLRADVGITGANAIAADTGAVLLVENEGNIRMTTVIPPVHIVYDGIDKLVPNLHYAFVETMVQSAYAGLYPPTYVNLSAGPSSTADVEMFRVSPVHGPREFHMVLVDNGRREAAKDKVLREALLCIRCGRCFLHCPVYKLLDGSWGIPPYTGPMGIMWSAVVNGMAKAGPHAVLCVHAGNCREVCPMGIDITGVIHYIRSRYMEMIAR